MTSDCTCTGCYKDCLVDNAQCDSCGQKFCSGCSTWWDDGREHCCSCQEGEHTPEEEHSDSDGHGVDEGEENECCPGNAGFDSDVQRWRDANGRFTKCPH